MREKNTPSWDPHLLRCKWTDPDPQHCRSRRTACGKLNWKLESFAWLRLGTTVYYSMDSYIFTKPQLFSAYQCLRLNLSIKQCQIGLKKYCANIVLHMAIQCMHVCMHKTYRRTYILKDIDIWSSNKNHLKTWSFCCFRNFNMKMFNGITL